MQNLATVLDHFLGFGSADYLWLAPRIVVAAGLTAVIGWEREDRNRPAGLRTHMLIGTTTAVIMLLGEGLYDRYGGDESVIRLDPLRLLEAIVGGVGFIGAGTVFVAGEDRVRGLTTAASLLAVAILGACIGLGMYGIGLLFAVLVVVVLRALSGIEERLGGADRAA